MRSGEFGFGKTIGGLVSPGGASLRTMTLVPSSPRECDELDELRAASVDDLFDGAELHSREDAECVRSGLFLYFGALDESHRISQRIPGSTGSYWHGIMHRQEADWSNAKYWFRRTGRHPVYGDLERETGLRWDPFEFVDRCEAASNGRGGTRRIADLQMLEWRLLMLHCCRSALGR